MYRGGLSPRYVLDEAQQYELIILAEGLNLRDRESWEQTRMLAYTIAQVNSSKRIKVTDIMKFPWDNEVTEKDTSVSKYDMERLRLKAKEYLNKK